MAKKQVMFTFPQTLIREPIIYTLDHRFKVVTNIRQADVSENKGSPGSRTAAFELTRSAATLWRANAQ